MASKKKRNSRPSRSSRRGRRRHGNVAATTHLVQWHRPESVFIGKNKSVPSADIVYRSKCGRFEIRKRHYASARHGYFNTVGYVFTVLATGKRRDTDTLADAKTYANWEVDPNWEPS